MTSGGSAESKMAAKEIEIIKGRIPLPSWVALAAFRSVRSFSLDIQIHATGRLYFMSLSFGTKGEKLKSTDTTHYFESDTMLHYEPFFADFGPLNLSQLYRFCNAVNFKLTVATHNTNTHHTNTHRMQSTRARRSFTTAAQRVSSGPTPLLSLGASRS